MYESRPIFVLLCLAVAFVLILMLKMGWASFWAIFKKNSSGHLDGKSQ
jgi:hypothetical protein